MKMKMVAALSLFFVLLGPINVQAGDKTEPILAVKFHADWCGSCKAMGPLFSDLKNKFDQKNVLFVKLDFTNSTTSHHSKLLSKALGIEGLVKENQGTGFILLLNQEKKIVHRFTKQNNIKEISKVIKESLASGAD